VVLAVAGSLVGARAGGGGVFRSLKAEGKRLQRVIYVLSGSTTVVSRTI
jgi:hypothetical protein